MDRLGSTSGIVMENLKQRIEQWWQDHPQTYEIDGSFDRQNIFTSMDDSCLEQALDDMQLNMIENAYYAQDDDRLFSNFFPSDLKVKNVLEIGCGLGAHTEALARAGANVWAIDLNETSVEITRRRLDIKQLEGTVTKMDAEHLEFAEGTFDFVWSWGVIHHTPEFDKCCKEIQRVCKPGGTIGLMVYNRHSIYNFWNVIFLRGILRAELLDKTILQLQSENTDGVEFGGNPHTTYWSRKDIRDKFSDATTVQQKAYGQKQSLTTMFPRIFSTWLEGKMPDSAFIWLLGRVGFLLFTEFKRV